MSSKKVPDRGKEKPVRKRSKIDLKLKLLMIQKYKGGESISSIGHQLGFSVSTINTIVKDASRIKEHVRGSAPLNSTIITKRRTGAIYEMEKLLLLWIEDHIQKRVSLSLHSIQEKARTIYEDIKNKDPNAPVSFVASNGWFNRFKIRAGFHNVTSNSGVGEQAGSGDTISAVEKCSNVLKDRLNKGEASRQELSVDIERKELVESQWKDVSTASKLKSTSQPKVLSEQEALQDEEDQVHHFTEQEMDLAFREIDMAMSRFDRMDLNTSRFLKVLRGVEDALTCYKEIYEEKLKATTKSDLSLKTMDSLESSAKIDSPQPGPS